MKRIEQDTSRITAFLKANLEALYKKLSSSTHFSTVPSSQDVSNKDAAAVTGGKGADLNKEVATVTPTTNSSQADPTAAGAVSYANAVKAPKPKPKCEPIVRVSQSNRRNEATARALSDACNESARKRV